MTNSFFELRHSCFIRHSSLGIRHFPFRVCLVNLPAVLHQDQTDQRHGGKKNRGGIRARPRVVDSRSLCLPPPKDRNSPIKSGRFFQKWTGLTHVFIASPRIANFAKQCSLLHETSPQSVARIHATLPPGAIYAIHSSIFSTAAQNRLGQVALCFR